MPLGLAFQGIRRLAPDGRAETIPSSLLHLPCTHLTPTIPTGSPNTQEVVN